MITVVDLRTVGAAQVDDWIMHLAENLRPADVAEIAASCGLDPEGAIRVSVHYSSHGYVVLDGSQSPIAIFGAAPDHSGSAIVWMVGTEGIQRNYVEILRKTGPCLDHLNAVYPVLWNYVDARNKVSIRWLKWSGCKIVGSDPEYGAEKRLFHKFIRTLNV